MIQSVGGRETIFRDIEAGDFFGELAAIDGQSRSAGIFALSDATIARMMPSTFVDAVTRNPAVAKRVLVRMASRARALVDRVREFNAMGIHERLVAELLRMSQIEEGEPGRALVSPPPTHAHLAGLVGTRRDSISKELGQMRKAGLIEVRRDALVLPDVQRIMRELSTQAKCDA
jgi:CRP-like cAMP-binding protein